jgi:hypothetical protein
MMAAHANCAAFLLLIMSAPAMGQTIFQCKDATGNITVQDTPCSAGSSEKRTQLAAKASISADDAKRRDEVAKLRAFSDACTPKTSVRCVEFEARLLNIESTMVAVADIDEKKRALQLNQEAEIVSTRINHRIAKADYERADQRLRASYGADNFNALLAERSDASARMSKARARHYALTRTWLD